MIRKMIALTLALLTLMSVFGVSESKYDDNDTIVAMIGDASDFVYAVEQALVKKGFLLEDEADGYFDKYTERAVMNFQTGRDYEANGLLTKRQLYWLDRATYNDWFDTSYIVYITNGGTR
ncbi:MAG: peptidoglycan-binding protein, partial [Clostridia bacterium]|nr:peptidoglycan-binding protein [Clostridia bacterium]